ncbi:hypothetical protein [Pseudobutyrivibrio xylanivorans]|uniref:Uncharacterized protein n=1 Tax=Pseudobutyrivibrio xylanivorans TaxID=185007 RepID=A0A5P6VUC1_PSEXY|nr:hypothetical protein [Pseudobutyrivibrio xylanivorans]QFJ56325.1 hypothetical protein FXF36_15520 [Pseudobutyrivibrio xylanivorans]
MKYRFCELFDNTVVSYTEMQSDGSIKTFFECSNYNVKKYAECLLPAYEWSEIEGYSKIEIQGLEYFLKKVEETLLYSAGMKASDSIIYYKYYPNVKDVRCIATATMYGEAFYEGFIEGAAELNETFDWLINSGRITEAVALLKSKDEDYINSLINEYILYRDMN